MKNPLLFLSIACLLPVLASLRAQSPSAPEADPFLKNPAAQPAGGREVAWKNGLLVLEVYALDKNAALGVLEHESGSAARYRRVTELAKAGEARLETLTVAGTILGQRVLTASVDSVRYASDFISPDAKGAAATPENYEVRDVGDTLEFEANVNPAGKVEVNLVPQRVRLLGFREAPPDKREYMVGVPAFGSQKITTSAIFPPGEPFFLGSFNVATGDQARLAFVRLHLLGPSAADLQAPAKPSGKPTLIVEYSLYSVERGDARDLLVDVESLTSPWDKLQPLLAAKKARFERLVAVNAKSGERAQTEEIAEWTLHTESVDPGVPVSAAKEPAPKEPVAPASRAVGGTFEVEPVLEPDSVTVSLNQYLTLTTERGPLSASGEARRYPPQTVFENRRLTMALKVLAGRHILLGTFNPPGANGVNDRPDDGRTSLLFVRAVLNEP